MPEYLVQQVYTFSRLALIEAESRDEAVELGAVEYELHSAPGAVVCHVLGPIRGPHDERFNKCEVRT